MEQQTETSSSSSDTPSLRLVDVDITTESVALNVMVSFLTLAQKRGSFTIDESAKIWECIKKFQQKPL